MFVRTFSPQNIVMTIFKFSIYILMFNSLISAVYASPQITNGQPATPGQFPFMTEIISQEMPISPYSMGGCGGALIAPQWVLTAAHCVLDYFSPDRNMPKVVIGAVNFGPDDHFEVINVDKILFHPGLYMGVNEKGNVPYDFALMHLVSRTNTAPVTLIAPNSKFEQPENTAITMGWGNTGSGPSEKLMYVSLPIAQPSECENLYKNNGVQWFNRDIMICAGSTSATRYNAAGGDSGGPLIVEENKQYYLAGIVSWGANYLAPKPAVFGRVSSVENWIFSVVNTFDETPSTNNRALSG